jgi:hypothetical protein
MSWRHMGEWRYSSTFLDFPTRWSWVVSFTPLPFYLRRKMARRPLYRRLGGTQSCGEENNLSPLPGIEPRPSSPSLYRLSYPGSNYKRYFKLIAPAFKLLLIFFIFSSHMLCTFYNDFLILILSLNALKSWHMPGRRIHVKYSSYFLYL